ncbi:MAG: UbiA prenyltransferase family protein [Candidatus Omnitrophica bacterium]|nr:UbiA prenyltransferase family protein [Candidatus Omnitrophota bacterium]
MIDSLKKIAAMFRAKHWIKNLFIFAPLLFSGCFLKNTEFLRTLTAFSGFCLITSGVYILNDFFDKEIDKLHPQKKYRYFVSHNTNIKTVLLLGLLLFLTGLVLCSTINRATALLALAYIFLNIFYATFLKNIPFIEIFSIVLGFLLRIWIGSTAANVLPSFLIQACILFLALFLVFTKRRYELLVLKEESSLHRPVLKYYNVNMFDQLILGSFVCAIIFYVSYILKISSSLAQHTHHNIIYSLIFVVYGMARYLYLVYIKKMGDDPCEVILSDKWLLVNILLWLSFNFLVLYF